MTHHLQQYSENSCALESSGREGVQCDPDPAVTWNETGFNTGLETPAVKVIGEERQPSSSTG